MNLLQYAATHLSVEKKFPSFKAGDTITIHYKIKEGDKERIQQFTGIVIQRRGEGRNKTFTVRKISHGVGVERIFPLYSPYIEKIEVDKVGEVRRAKLFYLRKALGKKAKIDELKVMAMNEDGLHDGTPLPPGEEGTASAGINPAAQAALEKA